MIPQTVLGTAAGPLSRPAAIGFAVVGDPREPVFDAVAVSVLEAQSRVWYGLRRVLMRASYERKRTEGAAGFFASDQVFPGLG